MKNHRRKFLQQTATISVAAFASPVLNFSFTEKIKSASEKITHLSPLESASEDDFWNQVRQAYTVNPNIINLNNGGVSPQPKVVQDAFV